MEYILRNEINPKLSTVEQLLVNRGFAVEDIPHYLNTDDSDIFDPCLLDNMKEGTRMLVSHIAKNDKIFIQIDADADGYTSAAALMNYLNMVFPHFTQSNISYRPHTSKQHGLLLDTIPDDVKLVIAPDASSNDFAVHKELKDKGIDVLVLDHHLASHISENACIINNQMCDYPNKTLSGAGVVYKFCCYLDQLLDKNYADEILDLVALGLVSDMMDIRNFETKRLIDKGFSHVRNPYFKSMIAKNQYFLKDGISPIGIAFSISPYVNAVTRSGTWEEKVVLFESMLDFRGYEQISSTKRGAVPGQTELRVEQACRNCTNIKNRQKTAKDASLEIIEQIIKENNLLENKILLICMPEDKAANKNIAGLIANELANKYQKPTLVLNKTAHEIKNDENEILDVEYWWEGSGRSFENAPIDSCRNLYLSTRLAEYVKGHDNSFGFAIKDTNLELFLAVCNDLLKDYDLSPKEKVDFIFTTDTLNTYTLNDICECNSLWGQCMPVPQVALENVVVNKDNLFLFKGSTLKISVTLPNGSEVSLIKFGSSNEEYEMLYSELGCVTINVVGNCEINSYDGKPQILIKNYEIIRRAAYFF